MTKETFQMTIEAAGTEDCLNTYEIRRKWSVKGGKALVIELYPTISIDKCKNMDMSAMHLMNHADDFGWGEVRIVNLYSRVFDQKPTAGMLTEDVNNLSYIEEILEEEGIRDYDIVIAWGNTLLSHTTTTHAKIDLLNMMVEKGLTAQVKCMVADSLSSYGIHPLYLGLRALKEKWRLMEFPVKETLSELNGESGKESKKQGKAESGREQPARTKKAEKTGK